MIIAEDKALNQIYTEGNSIFLKSSKDSDRIRLGNFDTVHKRIVMHKQFWEYDERFKSYPFNEAILKAAQKCNTVRLICPEGKFDIPIAVILKYGSPLIYPRNDLTREIYIDINLINNYPAADNVTK
jgi:hypothetical protein